MNISYTKYGMNGATRLLWDIAVSWDPTGAKSDEEAHGPPHGKRVGRSEWNSPTVVFLGWNKYKKE